MEKAQQGVDSFIIDFERCVKDFTSHETVLTAYLKGSIDLPKMDIKEDLDKDKKNFEKDESSQTISLRPQTEKAKPIFEKRDIPQEKEILSLHSETMERLYNLSILNI